MTITWQNDCQVPTPTGTTVTSANTGTGTNIANGGTNNAISASGSVGSGNTFTSDTSVVPTVTGLSITQAWHLVQGGANQCTEYADGSAAQTHFRWVRLFNLDAAPAVSLTHGRAYTDTGHTSIAFSWQITTTRKVHVSENGGATSTDSTGTLTAGTWYSEVFEYDQVAKTATITYYALGSSTIVAQSQLTGVVGTYSIISVRFGIGTASAFTGQGFRMALAQMGDASVPRPDFGNAVPVANAGPDQSVEPYDAVTLDGSGSTDADGTVVGYTWSQTGGTAVTLSSWTVQKPTFTAPATLAGDTLTFSLTVTDNLGATSAPDTVTVAVAAHTFWQKGADGQLHPVVITQHA